MLHDSILLNDNQLIIKGTIVCLNIVHYTNTRFLAILIFFLIFRFSFVNYRFSPILFFFVFSCFLLSILNMPAIVKIPATETEYRAIVLYLQTFNGE